MRLVVKSDGIYALTVMLGGASMGRGIWYLRILLFRDFEVVDLIFLGRMWYFKLLEIVNLIALDRRWYGSRNFRGLRNGCQLPLEMFLWDELALWYYLRRGLRNFEIVDGVVVVDNRLCTTKSFGRFWNRRLR